MLYFITGKPGNGKTLYTIATIAKLAADSGRPVYYDGVPLLDLGKEKLKWNSFDVNEQPKELEDGRLRIWPSVPDGSIVIVDEVQRHWRQRSQGSKVPASVQAIETHRHFGLDLYFVSQDPQLVDINVRKLAWSHQHIKRRAGLELATIYTWNQKVASPDSKSDLKDAVDSTWKYPKEFYGYYKSSELHTAKRQIPWFKVVLAGSLFAFLIGALLYVFGTGWGAAEPSVESSASLSPLSADSHRDRLKEGATPNPWASERWVARVYGRPDTAPAYDRLQQVRSQPSPSGCSKYTYQDGTIECNCTTWQGSRIDMPVRQCVQMIKEGWFDPTRPYEDKKSYNVAYLNQRDKGSAGFISQSQKPAHQVQESAAAE